MSLAVVNTPHNPVGKVFSKAELEKIAAVAEEFNLIILSDEVVSTNDCQLYNRLIITSIQYDVLTFDGHDHFRIAASQS
jgi:kynurenine aminotransferase